MIEYLIIGILSLVFIGLLIFIIGALIVSKNINDECEQETYKLQNKKFYKWNGYYTYNNMDFKKGEGYFINEKDLEQFLKGCGIKLIWCREEIPTADPGDELAPLVRDYASSKFLS